MPIMNDAWIRRMARDHGMIEPYEDRQVRDGVISYGVSSYGYDMRVAREFKIFTNVLSSIVDPKDFDPKSFVEFEGDACIKNVLADSLATVLDSHDGARRGAGGFDLHLAARIVAGRER